MKQLKYKLWAKITALVLLLLFAATTFLGIAGTVYLVATDAFVDEGRSLRQEINESMIRDEMYRIMDFYENALSEQQNGSDNHMELFKKNYAREYTNLIFSITAPDGTVLHTNATGEAARYTCEYSRRITVLCSDFITETFYFASEDAAYVYLEQQTEQGKVVRDTHTLVEADTSSETGERVKLDVTWADSESGDATLTCSLADDLLARDNFRTVNYWLEQLIEWMDMVPLLTALSLILCLVLFIFLLVAAGHKEGVEGIYLNWFHRIPFDLLAAVLILGIIITVAVCMEFSYRFNWAVLLVFLSIGGALCLLLLMALLITFSARVKAGNWWRNTICWWLGALLCRIVRSIWHSVRGVFCDLSGCWQLPAIFAGVVFVELLALMAFGAGVIGVFFVLGHIALFALCTLLLVSFRRIETGGKALAEGNLHHQISTDLTIPPFRRHAEHLNRIGEGMQRAVDQQIKSERTKTELITNVSHDIKTPLTSIVNYVDLLKGLDIENGTAREYLDVLDRQSQRLRKLTEDLVEASKASAGSIPVELERTDPNLLLQQACGEYLDRFRELDLDVISRPSPAETTIMADGRLLWRVFDNLLGNICKYSLPGTRVYLTTEVKNGFVTVSFKNISRYALDVSAEELTERFVRGDASRSTEGSGLGLSIATSLTALQGGKLEISTDGDLFRADVTFQTVQ